MCPPRPRRAGFATAPLPVHRRRARATARPLASTNATVTELIGKAGYFGATQADTFWLMLCGFLVFFMQCGFALLEAGTVRAKNTKNILLKNLLDACIGALVWYFIGYGFAYDADACSGNDCSQPGAHKANGECAPSTLVCVCVCRSLLW